MMENMDTSIGMVLDRLKELGLQKNTFVIFSSDNGGGASNKPLQEKGQNVGGWYSGTHDRHVIQTSPQIRNATSP